MAPRRAPLAHAAFTMLIFQRGRGRTSGLLTRDVRSNPQGCQVFSQPRVRELIISSCADAALPAGAWRIGIFTVVLDEV